MGNLDKGKLKEENEIVKFEVKVEGEFAKVEFELKRDLVPEDLKRIKPPDPVEGGFAPKIVILSGRGPIWFYGFLIHHYHPTKAVAVYDPRLGGAVVIETHTPEVSVGDVVRV